MRPRSLAGIIKAGQEKLNKASFNAQAFLGELAEAYDIAALKLKKHPGADIYLSEEIMTSRTLPMTLQDFITLA